MMRTSAFSIKRIRKPRMETRSASCLPSQAGRQSRSRRYRRTSVAIPTDTLPKQEVKLSKEEVLRYSRHLIMPEVGLEGQLKLKRARVLLIGTGGFGPPLCLYFAAPRAGPFGPLVFPPSDF